MIRYSDISVVLQEVPNEISLSITITGCPLRCKGCHSPYLWKTGSGNELNIETITELLSKYDGMISCVLFMGGEWCKEELVELLKSIKASNLKTCLYTGYDSVDSDILNNLDFIKYGPWVEKLGGLSSKTTNQRFINVKTGELLNHLFVK